MSRKQKAIAAFIPSVLGNWGKFMKHLMAFSENCYADGVVAKQGLANGLPTIDLLELVPNLNETITSFSFLNGTSRVTDIALLKALAKRFNNQCDYLEIGSWRGESLINIAPYCRQVVSLSLSEPEMREMGFDEDTIKLDGYFLKGESNIKRIGHNSTTFDFNSLGQKFDLIFVDGDHAFEAVKIDTINAFKMLKDENSIIVWHDFGNHYGDMRNEVIGAVIEGTTEQQRNHIYRVSNTLCGIYIKGDFQTAPIDTFNFPKKTFEVAIKSSAFVKGNRV